MKPNTPGTVSLVLGLLAIATSIVLVGGPIGLVGMGFGVVGLVRVHRRQASNLRAAAAGTVLSAVAFLATAGVLQETAHHLDACAHRASAPPGRCRPATSR